MHKLGIRKEVKIKRTFAYKLKDLGMDKVIVFSENATSSHRLKKQKEVLGCLDERETPRSNMAVFLSFRHPSLL